MRLQSVESALSVNLQEVGAVYSTFTFALNVVNDYSSEMIFIQLYRIIPDSINI